MSGSDSDQLYNQALARLSRRETSVAGMREYLSRRTDADIDPVIEKLCRLGYLDDLRYARAFTRAQMGRDKGLHYIRQSLRQKGVRLPAGYLEELVSEMMQESRPGQTESDLAKAIVERRYPKAQESRRESERAFRGLLRRGFSSQAARAAVLSRHSAESED